MSTLWLLDRAVLKIHYEEDNTPLDNYAKEFVKLFTLREYKLYIRADGKETPNATDLTGTNPNVFIACTDGQAVRIADIKLIVNPSGVEGKDYKVNPFGGLWDIGEYNYVYDAKNNRWTTYTILTGQASHWRRKRITNAERTTYV